MIVTSKVVRLKPKMLSGNKRVKSLRNKLWELCKQITRLRHGNTCYTCDKPRLEGVDWQTGHMWPKGAVGHSLKYDLRILRPQCFNCNINLGGMGAVFYRRMTKEIGNRAMEKLELEKIESKRGKTKADWVWFYAKIEEYNELLDKEKAAQ